MPVRRERGLIRPMYAPGPGPSSIRNWSAPHIDAAAWDAKREGGEQEGGVGGRREGTDGETRRKKRRKLQWEGVVLGWEARRVCVCEGGGECVSWPPLLATNTPTPDHCPHSPCLVHPARLGEYM